MNRTYAIPAAIALSAHALLFVGSGEKPTTGNEPTEVHPKLPEGTKEDDPRWVTVKFFDDAPKPVTNPTSDAGGGDIKEPPIGIPEIPRFGPVEWARVPQEYTPVEIGEGRELPTKGLRLAEKGAGGRFGKAAFTPSMLDRKPRTRSQLEPIYPQAMKLTGVTGTVWVEFMVDETGLVHDVRVIKSTNRAFEDATLTAVSQWRFEPGKSKGIPVSFRMGIPIVFNLND